MPRIAESELILNPDGSIYHLHLLPEDLSSTIILVGDPDRVERVSRHFDTVQLRKQKREFVTHTGTLKGERLTVISTGIGTDNIDIVLNELDALVNIDLKLRQPKPQQSSLRLIRIGTSGALQPDIPVDAFVVSEYGLGLDNLMLYYQFESQWPDGLLEFCRQLQLPSPAYASRCSANILSVMPEMWTRGITVTAPGFYGPQGRRLRAAPHHPNMLDELRRYQGQPRITNFEMETAAIYALGSLLGHQCLSVNVIIANRATGQFSANPSKAVDNLIEAVLEVLI